MTLGRYFNRVLAGLTATVSVACVCWLLPSRTAQDQELAKIQRHETQANTFEASSQSAATVANAPGGSFLVAWHSRRQQDGTYGIYLQRFDSRGNAVGGETQVNLFTESMQMNPAVACDEHGAWVAWESYGQDGSFNAIVARRFSGPDFVGGDEVLVNQFTRGDQSSVVISSDRQGNGSFFWVTPNPTGSVRQIASRKFSADGTALNDEFLVSPTNQHQSLPAVATDSVGNSLLVWSEQDKEGNETGIFGMLSSQTTRFSVTDEAGIEPAIDVLNNGNFAVSWLCPRNGDYEVVARSFDRLGQPLCDSVCLTDATSNIVSGAAMVADSGAEQFVALWNQQHDELGEDVNVVARRMSHEGLIQGEVFDVNSPQKGKNRLTIASGKRRAFFDGEKLVATWNGTGGTDSSAVNLTAVTSSDTSFAFGKSQVVDSRAESSAKPHEPPTFDRKLIAADPFGGFNVPGPTGPDFGFVAINSTGWTPPDPILAVGPNHIVAMTNGAIAFFTKDGTLTFSDEIENSFGFWGAQGATNFVFDPEVLFDPHSQRFFAMANERGNNRSYFLLAVSDDDDPNGNWFKYRFDVTNLAANNIDSPNMAIDDEVVYLTADFFGPDRYLVYMLRKSDLLVGNTPQTTDLLVTGSQSYGIPLMYDAGAPAFYMIQAFEFGTYNSVRMHAITNQLTTPQRVTTDVTVPTYGHPADPPQQGTSNRPELFEARFWSCVYRNGSLWAVHHHSPSGSRARVRWYEFDMRGWPTSGQVPTLVQSGEISPENSNGQLSWTYFPSIWVDADNNAAITMARSSSTEFITMARALRSASDPLGEFQPVVNVQASSSAYTAAARWGDYSGTGSDPTATGVFWGIHEFVQSNNIWQTYIAKYELAEKVLPNALVVETGVQAAGDVSSVADSDDVRLSILADVPTGLGAAEVSVLFFGNVVDTDISQLTIDLEASANTINLLQSVEVFNVITNEFEAVDMRNAELSDSQIEVVLTGDVTRFVTPASGQIITRLKFNPQGPVVFFPWSIEVDQLNWNAN